MVILANCIVNCGNGEPNMNTYFPEQREPKNFTHLLRPVEVAEILNISRSFAYHLLQTGEIPVVRLGKACRIRPDDLNAFIEKNPLAV